MVSVRGGVSGKAVYVRNSTIAKDIIFGGVGRQNY
jgi:hypothetical protein